MATATDYTKLAQGDSNWGFEAECFAASTVTEMEHAPTMFRAGGANRAAVVLSGLRLVANHGCAVRTLAGKVFDRSEYSMTAEVLGPGPDRLRLAAAWEKQFDLETAKTGRKERYSPAMESSIGTHFIEAVGGGEMAAVDVFDLVSGEYVVPINVAYVRRVQSGNGQGVMYSVQMVVDVPEPKRVKSLAGSLNRWRRVGDRQARMVTLGVPPEPPDGLVVQPCPYPPRDCVSVRSASTMMAVGMGAGGVVNFAGGVDYV